MALSTQHNKIKNHAFMKASILEAQYVDEPRAKLFANLNITTIEDLLFHAPARFLDVRPWKTIAHAELGEGAYIGTIHEIKVKRPRPRLAITEIAITDGTGVLVGVWFNQPWIQKTYAVGERVIFAGSVGMNYGLKQIKNPFVEKLGEEKTQFEGFLPVHPLTEGISQGWMRRIISMALYDFGNTIDILPNNLRQRHNLYARSQALRLLHFPHFMDQYEHARQRLAYEELLIFELMAARKRHRETVQAHGIAHALPKDFSQRIGAILPFTPTEEQQRAIDEILADMQASHPMNRMLLGDVGTGKTLVAFVGLALAALQDKQAAMMAPTEVLAQQYAAKLGPLLDKLGIPWALLTGSTPASEKKDILAKLESNEIGIVFGTHALIQPTVVFADLSFVVVDEQHRFGVKQRKTLKDKGNNPDVLVMSATPIPRTLAATAYGDLAISRIAKRPNANAGFSTAYLHHHQAYQAYDAIKEAVAAGQQAYVVCALIDESNESEIKAAETQARHLQNFELATCHVGLLTGKMRPSEKAEVMEQFKAHELDVLVSTTVIEVGVDVPNATCMVILDADRFGVAQLHQLRGRVGRGGIAGRVWLVSDAKSNESQERFKALLSTDDGFELAEFDLKQRGPGDLLGVRQSGLVSFRIADLTVDQDLVLRARADAFEIVARDYELQEEDLCFVREAVIEMESKRAEWVSAS